MMEYSYSPSRRELMMKMAAAASAVPFLGLAGCGGGAASGRTAVVIGAGMAGRSAAYELQKAGFKVTIMEKWGFAYAKPR